MKIPEKIVDIIEQRNRLNKEIADWCKKNLDMEGMDPDSATIETFHAGEEQKTEKGKEWCDQQQMGEDWFVGNYYWETQYKGKYLHMPFDIF